MGTGATQSKQSRGAVWAVGQPPKLPSPLLGTLLFIVLAGIAPALVIGATQGTPFRGWTGIVVICVVAAAHFSWAVASRSRHLVEMVISLFAYGFLGLAPLVQMRLRADVGTTPSFVYQYAWTTVFIILAGYAALLLGGLFSKTRGASTVTKTSPSLRIPSRRVVLVTIAAFALTAYYVSGVGVANLFQPRAVIERQRDLVWSNSTTAALVLGFSTMTLLVAVVAQILLFRQRKQAGDRAPIVLLGITLISLLVVVNPVSSARYQVGTVYLAILAACGIWRTLRAYRTVSILTMAGLFFLFPLASTFRDTLAARVTFEGPLKSLTSGDFDAFHQINNAAYYVDVRGITWGEQFLGVVFFWVPRSIWPGKAVDTGILLADYRGYGFTNLSAPLWAELFVNGGWVALILGMLALGFGVRRWDARLDTQISVKGTPALLGCIVPYYLLIVLRGSLLQSMAALTIIVLVALFLTVRSPEEPLRAT